MKKFIVRRNILSIMLIVMVAVTMTATPIYAIEQDSSTGADSINTPTESNSDMDCDGIDVEEPNIIEIKSEDLPSHKEWEKQVNEIGKEILIQLHTKSADEYEKVIAKASMEKEKDIENIYDKVLVDVILDKGKFESNENNNISNAYVPTVELDENAYQQLTSAFVISDSAVFEITPLYVSLEIVGENLDENDSADMLSVAAEKTAVKKSTNGYSTKVYYSGGTKIATSKVNCNFYYNGTKAWYKSGLSGSLKINALANWKKLSGSAHRSQYSSSEKSYWAYYTGKVAQYGELWGGSVSVRLKTVLVQAGVVCSRTGYLTTKNTAYEIPNN